MNEEDPTQFGNPFSGGGEGSDTLAGPMQTPHRVKDWLVTGMSWRRWWYEWATVDPIIQMTLCVGLVLLLCWSLYRLRTNGLQ